MSSTLMSLCSCTGLKPIQKRLLNYPNSKDVYCFDISKAFIQYKYIKI